MIMLNLLSQKQKEALQARVVFAMIERLMIFTVAASLSLAILLLMIKIRLTQNLDATLSRQLLSTEYLSTNNETKRLNEISNRVEALQQSIVPVADLVQEVVTATPPGVKLANFDYDVKTGTMRVNGTAGTRNNLLDFEAALRGLPFVKSLNSPISNLFQKTNISFNFETIIKNDVLKKRLEP